MNSRTFDRPDAPVRFALSPFDKRLGAVTLMAMVALLFALGCGGSDPLGDGDRPQRQLYGEPPQTSNAVQAPPVPAPPVPAPGATASAPGQPPGFAPVPGAAPPFAGDPNAIPGAQPGGPAAGGNPLAAMSAIARMAAQRNYRQWKPEQFQQAKNRRDPLLIEAIAYIGPNRASSDKTAQLLIDLLTKKIDDTQQADPGAAQGFGGGVPGASPGVPPGFAPPGAAPGGERFAEPQKGDTLPTPGGLSFGRSAGGRFGEGEKGGGFSVRAGDQPPGGFQPGGPPGFGPGGGFPGQSPETAGPFTDEQLAAAAIKALGANRTPTARGALKQIVQGQLETIVPDATSTPLALTALLGRPSDDELDLVVAAATTPAKVRAAAKAEAVASTDLQNLALAAIESSAPPAVQSRLIKRAVASTIPADDRKRLMDVLVKPSPASVAGQVDLFVTLTKDDPLRKTLEHHFATYSAAAMDRLMGLPPGTVPPPSEAGQSSGFGGGGGIGGGDFKGLGRFGGPGGLPQQPPVAPGGFPGQVQQPGQEQQIDDAQVALIVQNLWTDRVVKAVAQEAVGLEGSPEEFADPLQLGITMPVQSMRNLLDGLQREWWRDGTDHLLLGQRWGDLIRDPALLIVVKRTARKEDPAVRDLRLGKTPPPGAGAPGEFPGAAPGGRRGQVPRATPQGPNAERQAKEDKARYQWMKASEEFVQSLNARFYAAAQAGAGAPTGGPAEADSAVSQPSAPPASSPSGAAAAATAKAGSEKAGDAKAADGKAGSAAPADPSGGDPTKLPLALHAGAKVVAEYHLNWPADVQAKIGSAAVTPLVVHYVRIEEQGSLAKLVSHYQKQLRGASNRLLADGRWLDFNGIGASAGQARSVDVMLTRAGGGGPPAAGGSARGGAELTEDLVVEILTVEAADPKVRPPTK